MAAEKGARVTRRDASSLAVTWMAGALCVLAMLPLSGASCGPHPPDTPDNGTRMHAHIALTIEKPLLAVHTILEARRDLEKAAARQRSSTAEELDDALTLLERQYAPVDNAWVITQEAYEAYTKSIRASGGRDTPIAAEFALALLSRWQSLIAAAEAIGLDLPPIPEVFTNGVAHGPA
jgi:hypothetical protein